METRSKSLSHNSTNKGYPGNNIQSVFVISKITGIIKDQFSKKHNPVAAAEALT